MRLIVHKKEGTMEVHFTLPGICRKNREFYFKIDVITNVCKEKPDNSKSIDESRLLPDGTNATQVNNGTYKIVAAIAPTTGEGEFGTGQQGLCVDTYVMKKKYLLDENGNKKLDKDGNEIFVMVKDTGYMIHITPYNNTWGCIGIKYNRDDPESKKQAEYIMDLLVNIYLYTMSKMGDKDATITYED